VKVETVKQLYNLWYANIAPILARIA